MNVVDDQGRLFGLVNVIDALVVLLVLAVVVAGVAFVDPFSSPEPTTRYATVDLGSQPRYVAELIQAGDVMAPPGTDDNLTVTDVHLSPASGENVSVVLRTEIEGALVETDSRTGRAFSFAGGTIRQGDSLEIVTEDYGVTGRVTEFSPSGAALQTSTVPAVVELDAPTRTADRITAGDTITIVDRSVARIESVAVTSAGSPTQRHLRLGVSLDTVRSGGFQRFAGVPLRIGSTIPLTTANYDVNGTITAVGTTEPPGEPVTRTVEVKLSNVQPEFADGLRPGLTESVRGTTYAEVTGVDVRPAVITLTSEGGDIFRREHPVKKDVTLTVEVRARSTPGGLTFHADPLRQGQPVTFEFRTVTVEGTVVGIGG